jgi:hypothetical protein
MTFPQRWRDHVRGQEHLHELQLAGARGAASAPRRCLGLALDDRRLPLPRPHGVNGYARVAIFWRTCCYLLTPRRRLALPQEENDAEEGGEEGWKEEGGSLFGLTCDGLGRPAASAARAAGAARFLRCPGSIFPWGSVALSFQE